MNERVRTPSRIVAVIQARMGSTRLPGKVLKPVAGRPVLWHIVHRLEKSRLIERIAVATGDDPHDDAIVEYCRGEGIAVVRGPKDDALASFVLAVRRLSGSIVVRVDADAPFTDGEYADHLITAMTDQDCDFVFAPDNRTGIDVFTSRGLDRLAAEAGGDPVARDRVSAYFRLHLGFVPTAFAGPFAASGGAPAFGNPDDLEVMETTRDRLQAHAGEASLSDLMLLLEHEPALRREIKKETAAPGAAALIVCNGLGPGGGVRVRRLVALARALRDREGIGSVFAAAGGTGALSPIRKAGFDLVPLADPEVSFEGAMTAPDILILGGRCGPKPEALVRFAESVPVTASIGDLSERRLLLDFAYLPPLPKALALSWVGSRCQVRIGWQWSLAFPPPAGRSRSHGARPLLLVTMKGANAGALTLRAARALAGLPPAFRARFAIGPKWRDSDSIARKIISLGAHFETIEGPGELTPEYARADLALATFGNAAFDLAAAGVPAIYLCDDDAAFASASAFEAAGMGTALRPKEEMSDAALVAAVGDLMNDDRKRHAMQAAGLLNIDGAAVQRIAADLAAALNSGRRQGTAKGGR